MDITHAVTPGRKKVYNMEPRTPLKRQRIPVQRFQSPVLEEGAPKPKIPTEEKILLFKKGTFLAVRNPEGSFYVCKAQQIVYRSSKRFRIQWLNLVQPPDVYKLDYMDATELECVLCDVKMDRIEKDTYRLHFVQQSRAEKALKKVLNLERGLPINEGIDEDEPLIKRKKAVESSPKPSAKDAKVTSKGKGKTEKAAAGKRKGGGGKNPDKKLKPNPNIVVLDKEPFFETNEAVPFISAQVNGKLAIRAVLLNDMTLLKSLTHGLDYLRSPNNKLTALHYAIQRQNRGAVIYLAEDYFSSNRKSSQQKTNLLIKSMNTGWYNPTFLGIRNIRALTVGRGNREGNNALTKDINEDVMFMPENFFEYAVSIGASKEILELLFEANQNETRDEQLVSVYQNIHQAIVKGHRKLAGKLIEEAEKAGGHGYNYLHKEVLLFEKEDLRANILPASVRKKPFYSKITPLHCAAINPNIKYLQTLVGVEPDINIVDKWQRRPIHYAAACVSSAPLEYLLEKFANPSDEDSSGMSALHFAAQAGRPQNVDILLKRAKNLGTESDVFATKYGPAGINRSNRFGSCPLHLAITNGHTDVVKVLLKHQVDVNKPLTASKDKMTPLMIAACKGHLEIARLLVGQKAFIEQTDKMKRTALTHAAMNGNTHLVSYFLSLGADPNHTDSSGNSVVHYAAAYGWFFSLKLLVANGGANPNLANDWKMTPVCIAFLKGHFGLVDLLLNQPGVDINFKDDKGRTLVSIAASSKLVPELMDQLNYLLNKKADCSLADLEGYNPLHHLARNMHSKLDSNELPDADTMKVSVDVANFLIDNGCDPTARANDGITPLMLAIEKNNVLLVKALLLKKGSVSLDKNKNNKNILHMMAELCIKGDMSSILRDVIEQNKKMLEETTMEIDGVSPPPDNDVLKQLAKMVDNEGFTPLLRACQKYKNLQMKSYRQKNEADLDKARANARSFILMLIDDAGSDVNATVQKKYFKDASSQPQSEEEQYVSEGKWSSVHFMVAAVHENNVTTDGIVTYCPGLKLLLTKKPKLDHQDIKGCVPLIQAINLNRPYAVKLLLLAGANPNCSWSAKQVTPLLLVAQNGKPELIKMLVDAHANLDVTNALTQQTPLHLACENKVRDSDALKRVQILTEAGANVNALDSKGLTPLHCAVKHNTGELDSSTDMEELLIRIGADVFLKDKRKCLPLHYAFGDMDRPSFSTADPIELIQTLTSAMQHRLIDEPDSTGLTPLHRAACRGATICCRHLMRMNADTNRKDCYGNTPLAYAVRYKHDSCAIMLLQQGANVKENVIIPPADSNLSKYAQNADRKLKPIWKWQPIRNIANRPEKKVHPIFQEAIASELQNVAYVMLDSNGMDLRSGIESALCVSKYNVALRLIKKVHDISRLQSTNQDSRNLLHMLALCTKPGVDTEAQLKIARILLEKGVSLNQTDMYGCTPLMYAALMHQPYRLGQLMSNRNPRLDIKHKDRHGRDVMAAFFWHYDKVSDIDTEAKDWLKMLISLDASLDILFDLPPPHPLLFGEQVTFQRMNYFTRCDGPLITPLIFAICSYNTNLVRFLLKNGASPNFADEKGLTPIMHAVKKNDINIVKLLLNYDYHPEQTPEVTKADLPKMPSQQLFTLKMMSAENKTPSAAQANGNGSAVDDLPEVVSVMAEEGTDATDKVDDIENGASDMSDAEVNDVDNEDSVGSSDESNDEKDGDNDDEEYDDNEGNDYNDNDDGNDTDEVDSEETDLQQKPPIFPRLNSKASFMLKQGNQSSFSFRFDNIPTVEKTSIVNINCIDNDGRTVLHHLVCPLEYGTYDNDEILYVLFKAGAPLEFEDTAGLSPLKHALINGAPRLARMLQKLTGVERDKWEKPTFNCLGEPDGISNTLPNVDFESDSKAIESVLVPNVSDSGDEKEFVPQPDENCNIRASCEVVFDSSQSLPFDVLLTKVDVCCGVWGMYNFYKMQIVREKNKDLYVLFTRWGRIGDRGQFQHTPFFSIEEASKEFCKIFKSKTGNEWSKIKLFKNHPKKYRLVHTEDRLKGKKQPPIKFDLNSDLPSKLPPRLQELIKELSSVKMLSTAYSMCGIDTDILPFGQIKKEALLNALKILHQLRDLIEIADKTKGSAAQVQDYQTTCENIAKMSNEYFHLVPQAGYEYEKIRPIHDKRSLKNHLRKITNLLDYEMASRILLGAQYRLKEMNPLDYIYKAIGCHIKLMSENEFETQYILKYIYSTDHNVKVHAIYRLSRGGEEERVQELNLENRMLLWHGSRVPNFISILSRGLLISPSEAQITGHMFGEGIYTADTFTKAKNYCYHSNVGTNSMFALLCEVALGKMKTTKVGGDSLNASDVEYNSVVGVGREIPDSAFDVTLPYGATLPLGPLISNPTAKSRSFLEHNEYIVYDPAQVCQRYLVQFSD